MTSPTRFLFLALLALATTGAASQTVYRCGNEYSREPCANGKSVDTGPVAVDGKRAAEARQSASREHRLAEEMARDRRVREAALKPATASSLGPARATQPLAAASASMKPKKRAKAKIRVVDERDFVARVPKVKPK